MAIWKLLATHLSRNSDRLLYSWKIESAGQVALLDALKRQVGAKVATNESMEKPANALNEMLRANVPSVRNRIYPPGIRQDAATPRINIIPLTPSERRVGIGEHYGSGMGKWLDYNFRVIITDRDPNQVDKIASEVDYAVWSHRNYVPTVSTFGEFINLETKGGSATELNEGLQAYQRVMNISGVWLSRTTTTF
jgi:hypothetical protein